MQSKISNWSLIFKYSSLQFLMKATFGAVNNIIFYNIFGPAILGVIKLSEVIIFTSIFECRHIKCLDGRIY